ncbi:ATP-binding protein [Streptomyces sp. NPDC047525]|uniref:ATP-binding protein n=1 Tax=Streptomyces sp. NPDC047525 TaxID=3155264 RepID=UPI0033E26915
MAYPSASLSGRVENQGPTLRPAPQGDSTREETTVPPTAAELVQDQTLGQLVEHRTFELIAVAEPAVWVRGVVRKTLDGRTDPSRIDDTVLVTNELVTNAIQHAGGPVSFTLDLYEKGVTVGVVDRGTDTSVIPDTPESVLADLADDEVGAVNLAALPENGQGLYLISAISTAWGVESTDRGKVVTAAFILGGSST